MRNRGAPKKLPRMMGNQPRRSGMGEDPSQVPGVLGDPYASYDQTFQTQMQSPYEVFSASPISDDKELSKREELSQQLPQAVTLPTNLFIPDGAQSIDISALANVPPLTTVDLLTFRGRQGSIVRFIGYSIFNDALMLSLVNLVPMVNGRRVFPLHGNPNPGQNFAMGLGLGPDMATLVPATLALNPNDVLVWRFTNNDVVDVAAGVRMSGYLDQGTIRQTDRFGG